MDHPTEQALLDAARAGDRAALEQLLELVQPRVFSFGMKMCGQLDDAEEVLQETLIAVARSVRDFRGASSLSTWLYSIARSFCIKRRRHGKFAPERVESLDAAPEVARQLSDPGLDPEAAVGGQEIEKAMMAAIGELDPMYREVLVLRDGEGLTAPEVAEVLDLTVDAVKSRLHRARGQVRERLMAAVGGSTPKPANGCPDVAALLSQKLEGDISADLCAQMEKHLEGCPACREQCDSLQRTLVLCRRAGSGAVPAKVQASVRAAIQEFLSALKQP